VKFLQFDLGSRKRGEIVQVSLRGNAANVLLLDGSNFSAFKAGRSHRYVGGHVSRSPVQLAIPSTGRWYVVVNTGGVAGNVRASVEVLPGPLPAIRQAAPPPLELIREAADAYAESEAPSGTVDEKAFDVFISHATEDKELVAAPLADALRRRGLKVWYDDFELRLGDSLRRRIDDGLTRSRFGVVILSPAFFKKGWPQREMDGLVTREIAGDRQIILPIWHNVSQSDVLAFSAPLADKLARNTATSSIEAIAQEIADVTMS
jgi:hypothetical protein